MGTANFGDVKVSGDHLIHAMVGFNQCFNWQEMSQKQLWVGVDVVASSACRNPSDVFLALHSVPSAVIAMEKLAQALVHVNLIKDVVDIVLLNHQGGKVDLLLKVFVVDGINSFLGDVGMVNFGIIVFGFNLCKCTYIL